MKYFRHFLICFFAIIAHPAYSDALNGAWSGDFRCRSFNEAKFQLEASQSGDGVIGGIFTFDYMDGRNPVRGSHRVSGRGSAEGFVLSPTDWIERPQIGSSFAVYGRTRLGGAAIDVQFEPCGREYYHGSDPALMALHHQQNAAEAAPLQSGWPAGIWRGEISCGNNARNRTTRPVEAAFVVDGTNVLADMRFLLPSNRKGQEPIPQRSILFGTIEADKLVLSGKGTLNEQSSNSEIQSAILAGGSGSLEGSVKSRGCSGISLSYIGPEAARKLPEELYGSWIGSGGSNESIAASLVAAVSEAGDVAELRLSAPADRPYESRSFLHLILVPVELLDQRLLLLPVGARLQDFATDQWGKQSSSELGPFVANFGIFLSGGQGEEIDLVTPRSRDYIIGAIRDVPGQDQGARTLSLKPANLELIAALGEGETPPQKFPDTLKGPLVTAHSREAQCQILKEWIGVYAEGKDMRGTVIDRLRRELAEAFTDDHFVPVFGAPLHLLDEVERRALAAFMRDDCGYGQGMEDVSFAGEYVIGHLSGYRTMVERLANVAETRRWLAAAMQEATDLPNLPSSLTRIENLTKEMTTRSAELTAQELNTLKPHLIGRAHDIRAALLNEQLDQELPALSQGSVATGEFDRLVWLAEKVAREDLRPDDRELLHWRLLDPAKRLSADHIAALNNGADQIPISLDGLGDVQSRIAASLPVLTQMEQAFGLFQWQEIRPLTDRRELILNAPQVLAAFKAHLAQVPEGPHMLRATKAAASLYLDDGLFQRRPDYAAVYDEAIERAELLSIVLVDLSTNRHPGEPTIMEIAKFALSRVRDINASLAAIEDACFSGRVSQSKDFFGGLQCLSLPSVLMNRRGLGVELSSVTKISCAPERGGFYCYMKQTIDVVLRDGASGEGVSLMGDFLKNVGALEVQDALFLPSPTGWTVVWGDLN